MPESPGQPGGRFSSGRIVYPVLVLLTLAYLVCVVFIDPRGVVLSVFSDDAFYYFKIAKNITSGIGCTFDGIAPTNGFHPLWMLYVLLVYGISGGGLLPPLIVILVTGGLLACAALFLLHGLVDRYAAPGFGVIAVAVALLPVLLTAMINGLETGLQIFLVLLFVYRCYRDDLLDPSVAGRRAFIAGLFLGVIMLGRLDTVFLVIAVLFLTLMSSLLRLVDVGTMMRRAIAVSAGFALVTAPYLAWNRIVFGDFMPLSGKVKSTFPALRSPLRLMSDMRIGAMMIAAVVVLILFTTSIRIVRKRDPGRLLSSPLSLMALASILHFAYIFLFMDWGVYWWHFTLYGLTIALTLPDAIRLIHEYRPRLGLAAGAAVILVTLTASIYLKINEVRIKKRQHEGWMQAALWIRENSEPDAVIALLDAGLFGYFSQRNVINLDGKANGREFYDHILSGDLTGYLEKVGVDYVANVRIDYSSGYTHIIVQRPNARNIGLRMPEELEVYRSPPIPSGAPRFGPVPDSHFVIWKAPWSTAGPPAEGS